ncbi:multiple sugar transport system permease protein [Kribbella amoyensis]|uniref:Multiple sugar transport system permease protein n=1 Tax=Kribbella amoyensis TaxID=996641 RepID=A0A561BMT9_9ACTN|nr:carbohydrate ABC transporter permease [Kribbella amoyensis]TWD80206.1 multiple sugar transport system permease protein [Kribbella amoyensis]
MTEHPTTFASSNDLRRPWVAVALRTTQVLTLILLLVIGVGPLYWTLKGAVSPPAELVAHPLRWWPIEPDFGNFTTAFTELRVGRYLANTVQIVIGSWFVQLFVAMTAGFAFAVIRPRIGRYVYAAILATMFVPYTVSLVSLFLTMLDVPLLRLNLLDTYWAIWLPAGANAFNVLLATRFFEALPQELYDAAKVDGASTWQLLTRIVLPMSRPVIAVISLLAIMHSWKEFIWPLVVISDPTLQPISVALVNLVDAAPLDELIAAMAMALAPPVLVFLVLQRYVVAGLGFTGVKG